MTGSTASVAHSVAQAVEIHPDWVYAGLLPKDKLRIITQIRSQHGPVAMVSYVRFQTSFISRYI